MANGQRAAYEGYVYEVLPVQTFASGFKKREVVVTPTANPDAEKYTDYVSFTFTKDDTSKLDNVRKGMKVKLEFFIGGRKWDNQRTGKTSYFTELRATKIEVEGGAAAANVPEPATPDESFAAGDVADDDIPF